MWCDHAFIFVVEGVAGNLIKMPVVSQKCERAGLGQENHGPHFGYNDITVLGSRETSDAMFDNRCFFDLGCTYGRRLRNTDVTGEGRFTPEEIEVFSVHD